MVQTHHHLQEHKLWLKKYCFRYSCWFLYFLFYCCRREMHWSRWTWPWPIMVPVQEHLHWEAWHMYIRSKEWWLMVLAVDWLVCSLCVVSAKGSTGCLLIARLASYRNVHDAKLVYSRLASLRLLLPVHAAAVLLMTVGHHTMGDWIINLADERICPLH